MYGELLTSSILATLDATVPASPIWDVKSGTAAEQLRQHTKASQLRFVSSISTSTTTSLLQIAAGLIFTIDPFFNCKRNSDFT